MAENAANDEIDDDAADGAEKFRHLHERARFVGLLYDRMFAVCFQRGPGGRPNEVGAAYARVPVLTKLRVDVLAHLVEYAIIPSGSRRFRTFPAYEPDRGCERRGRQRTSAIAHLRLYWPARINDESGTDDRADQSFPSIGTFIREDDDHAAVGNERAVASLEGAEHPVFVCFLRCCFVTSKSAGIIYKFAVLLSRCSTSGRAAASKTRSISGESRQSVRRKPYIKEIH